MQKKFAQRLDDHNMLVDGLLGVVNDLARISEVQVEKGDTETAERIADIAEKCANIVETISESFEAEHSEELQLLKKILADKQ